MYKWFDVMLLKYRLIYLLNTFTVINVQDHFTFLFCFTTKTRRLTSVSDYGTGPKCRHQWGTQDMIRNTETKNKDEGSASKRTREMTIDALNIHTKLHKTQHGYGFLASWFVSQIHCSLHKSSASTDIPA